MKVKSTATLAVSYFSNQPYPSFTVDVWTIMSPVVTVGSALVAAYLGLWLSHQRSPSQNKLPNVPLQTQTQ